ncbi:unnamed protein product [Linum trigynum]|uniref:Uncharacterized protein n=1 Tax=Linum trigynum TaxID=586398 RepID=A0AAV2FM02_9ROSI
MSILTRKKHLNLAVQTSMLLAWMDLNIRSLDARKYTFVDIPQYYVCNKKYKKWQRRCAIQNADTNTPPPQGGLVDADGFTLVVNKKNKVWIGSGSASQGPRNLSSKLAAGQVNGKTVRLAVQAPPASPPKGRGRGKKRK